MVGTKPNVKYASQPRNPIQWELDIYKADRGGLTHWLSP